MSPRYTWLCRASAAVVWLVGGLALGADPAAKLNPFPEDAALESPAPQSKPAAQPPKSNFRPRFRPPAVSQAQHTEAAPSAQTPTPTPAKPGALTPTAEPAELQPAPSAEKQLAPAEMQLAPAEKQPAAAEKQPAAAEKPAAPGGSASQGQALLQEASAKSKTAASEAEYTAVIEACQQAKAMPLNQAYEDFARQLLGWAYNRRGEVRAKEGRPAEALADFEAAVETSGAWRAILNRGTSYAALGRDQEAMADFERAIRANPRHANSYFNRGELRYKQGDYEGAMRDYNAALTLGPPTSAMYAARGHAYYRQQRFGDALRDYGEAVQLDPSNADALINRGDTYSDVGKYGEAAKDYRAAVKIAPKSGRAFQAAAWLMATCPDTHYRDEKLAVDAAKRAIELDGPTYRNLSTLAAAQASAGDFAGAQKTQEQAIAAAAKDEVLTAEKMMSLYQREIAYRDRPFTAFTKPEEMDEDEEVQPAAAMGPLEGQRGPDARRAWFHEPAEGAPVDAPETARVPRRTPHRQGPPGKPQKTRLFAPSGRI